MLLEKIEDAIKAQLAELAKTTLATKRENYDAQHFAWVSGYYQGIEAALGTVSQIILESDLED